jgi:redox-sensitive bicupin YhaK (pirin superfamily)
MSSLSLVNFEVYLLDPGGSPIRLLDDFRVSGSPFGPHPHAGFSALTYLFEDSDGALRSRDSLGNDLVVGAGGLVWLQSGRGALHEETPQDAGRALHGAQIYVNLRAANKSLPPQTFWLQGADVPRWSNDTGNVVRVLAGTYRNVASPLVPAEPFRLLDLAIRAELELDLVAANCTLLYARDAVTVRCESETLHLGAGQVVPVSGSAVVWLSAPEAARVLVLSGAPINEPCHAEGPFILNHPHEVKDAISRYRRGEMGSLQRRS